VAIYALRDPSDGATRYIGKTIDVPMRYRKHLSHVTGSRCGSWITSLRNRGLIPSIHVLEWVSPDEWERAEAAHIALARRAGMNLVNISDGGQGAPGRKHRPESLAAMKKNNRLARLTPDERARSREWWGKLTQEERDQRMAALTAAAIIANSSPEMKESYVLRGAKLKGREFTPEWRAKISAALRGRPLSPEHCEKIRQRQTGRTHTDSAKAKVRAATTGRKHSPEARARMSAAQRGHPVSPEARRRMSLSHRGKPSPRRKKANGTQLGLPGI
jgi:hypothetical protein